ncbi:hypothetical protein N7530_008980 [Penicillium desertorum]|uniref:Cytochrome P450 n=1 Tax=Penicillium desertorum TaxID=1303715 RepID=A0A9X0BLP1_9EURO|nr:hypothetical protein N7530_008980 [Penicillium desertorum]
MRYRSFLGAGLTHEEISYSEMPLIIGLLANTLPAAFWVHFELSSRPKVLGEVCEEVEQNALSIAPNGTTMIDLGYLRDICPLRLSITANKDDNGSGPNRYPGYYTSGQTLPQTWNNALHASEAIRPRPKCLGGNSADGLDGRRFMRTTATTVNNSDKKKDPGRTDRFMAFSASPSICPGRHFAPSEISALVTMIALQYDISPAD